MDMVDTLIHDSDTALVRRSAPTQLRRRPLHQMQSYTALALRPAQMLLPRSPHRRRTLKDPMRPSRCRITDILTAENVALLKQKYGHCILSPGIVGRAALRSVGADEHLSIPYAKTNRTLTPQGVMD